MASLNRIIIGTRRSKLALWQTGRIKELLCAQFPSLSIEIKEIITTGDRIEHAPLPSIGGKGLFTAELEAALSDGSIDIAVHSLKDLPTEMDPQYVLAAICERESPFDVLISGSQLRFHQLPKGAVVGTSSLRRSAQLKRLRPDIQTESIRGNVDTRIAKVGGENPTYHAIVLAEAGVRRLGRGADITQVLSIEEMLPAPGQGALAVQCHEKNTTIRELLAKIDSFEARVCTSAERMFLATLNAGCSTPVAALTRLENNQLSFIGRCLSDDGQRSIELQGTAAPAQAEALGRSMGEEAIARGFLAVQNL